MSHGQKFMHDSRISFGEPLTVKDPPGNVIMNVYDTHGNLTSVATPKPNTKQRG